MMTYPLYRLVVLGVGDRHRRRPVAVLNRTRIGMMIRAGVDDRAMLSASGVNVHVVFAIVFAIGAGLAGFAGVVGGSALSIAPGEDVRYLLASLVVVIVGGMGSIPGAAIGALLIGLAEQIGLVYFADLRRRAHLRHHGGRAGVPAAGHHGDGAHERRPPILALDQPSAPLACRSGSAPARSSLAVAAAALSRWSRRQFFISQIGAYSLILGHDRAVADAARRLWRHGQPGADDRRRRRRLRGRDLRHQQHRRASASAGRGGSLVPFAVLLGGTGVGADRLRSRCAPRASTRS